MGGGGCGGREWRGCCKRERETDRQTDRQTDRDRDRDRESMCVNRSFRISEMFFPCNHTSLILRTRNAGKYDLPFQKALSDRH